MKTKNVGYTVLLLQALFQLENAASHKYQQSEKSTRLRMHGTCTCFSQGGNAVNLTTVGLDNGLPRFAAFSFPGKRSQYKYFYNPCYPFSWPPEYLTTTKYEEYKSRWENYYGPHMSGGLKWLERWKQVAPSYRGKCKNSAVCRDDTYDTFATVAAQSNDNGMIFCRHNKSINKMQIVYRGPEGTEFEDAGFVVTLICDAERDVAKLEPVYDAGRKCHWWFCQEGWKYVKLYHKCCCPGVCGDMSFIPLVHESPGTPAISTVVFVLAVIIVGMVTSTLMFWFWRHQKLKREYGRLARDQRVYGTLTDHVIPYCSIKLQDSVGEGSYGVVYKGQWRNTDVAVKRIREGLVEEDMAAFRREATILCNLRHHNIVQFMGVCLMRPNFCIVTEFMEGGSVADVVHVKRIILPWETRLKWATDAAKGMAFLHSANPPLMHRDLKSDNLLVDENGLVKVADFGTTKILETVLARRWKDNQVLSLRHGTGFTGFHTRLVGTVRWVAPEVMRTTDFDGPALYSTSADVYSYGITVWEMITNRRPFPEIQWDHEVMDAVEKGVRPAIPSFCLPEISSFVKQCWHSNPKERPTFANILSLLEEMSTYKANTGARVVLPNARYLGADV